MRKHRQANRSSIVVAKRRLVHVAVLLRTDSVLTVRLAVAQVGGSGSIEGTVTDPTGAVIAGATVTATNVATGVQTRRQTTDAGFYVLSPLPAGQYTVEVQAAGFQNLKQEHVLVDALATVGLNPKMEVGSASQSVTVTDAPLALKTDDATLGSSMQNETYDALPLAMNGVARDPTQFTALVAGATRTIPRSPALRTALSMAAKRIRMKSIWRVFP